MSEIGKSKMNGHALTEFDKISTCADDLMNKMSAIIWSLDSKHDSLANLVDYVRRWAHDYFEYTPVDCKVIIPPIIPNKALSGDKRRNVFLCIKETLNNVLKHAGATVVTIRMQCDTILRIDIYDNGCGINGHKTNSYGNGLRNMKNRMELIGGNFTIEGKKGTRVILELKI